MSIVNQLLGVSGSTVTGPDVKIGIGGTYQFQASCVTWNGAQLNLQVKDTNTNQYVNLPAPAILAAVDGVFSVDLGDDVTIRVLISVAVPSTPVFATLRRVRL